MLSHLAALIVYISTSICTWPTRILSDIVIFYSFNNYHYVRVFNSDSDAEEAVRDCDAYLL